MKRIAPALWPVFLAVGSGALFALALPPRDIEWLGWVALAPLLLAVSMPGRRALHAAGLGLLAGIAAGVVQVRLGDGVAPDRLNFAYLPYIWIALAFGTIAALVSVAGRRRPDTHPLLWALYVGCAGVAVEWLTTFSPLPVGIALCEYRDTALIQIAGVTGIWGVSFLLWFVNAAVAACAVRRRGGRAEFRALAVAAALVCLTYAFGVVRLRSAGALSRPSVTVAAVQDFSGTDGAADPNGTRNGGGSVPDIAALMARAAGRGARLIVGSEEAFGSAFVPDDPSSDPARVARQGRCYLAVGYQQPGNPKDFNCAALVGPSGRTLGIHRKVRLFLGERNAVQAGVAATVVDTADPALGRVGLLICFDTCWTDLVRAEAARGARIVALPNYDPPTPHAVLHRLHAALMPFRAVENGVALVRADPNGLSMTVDPWGRIVDEAPLYRAEALVSRLPIGNGQGTPFTRWGDWLAYLCAAVVAVVTAPVLAAIIASIRRCRTSR